MAHFGLNAKKIIKFQFYTTENNFVAHDWIIMKSSWCKRLPLIIHIVSLAFLRSLSLTTFYSLDRDIIHSSDGTKICLSRSKRGVFQFIHSFISSSGVISSHLSKVIVQWANACFITQPFISKSLFHGRTRTAYLYRCVWSGITGR